MASKRFARAHRQRAGLYNLFDSEPGDELFPIVASSASPWIARVPFDEAV